ncbi:MAG: phosphoglycerate dehydrogenase [Anaerolineae bacterium]|nr:phosphoglycerate dehydrogenase [Anaerolineae bacterium]
MEILISTSSFGTTDRAALDLLEEAGLVVRLNPHGRKLKADESIALLENVTGLIAGTETLDRTVLERAPKLRVISRVGTGIDNIDLDAARELGIAVFNTPDAVVDAVAELTLAGMLNLLRHVGQTDRAIRRGVWEKRMGALLRGKTVGIVGLGRVGKQVARLLEPFDVNVIAFDVVWDEVFANEFGVRYVGLDELVGGADLITLHLTYSAEVRHLLNRERLERCKKGALIVNCARGGLVDEGALLELLRAGHLGGAYLDAFEQEPYGGALCELENVVLTAHMGSYAAECRAEMELEAARNLVGHLGLMIDD